MAEEALGAHVARLREDGDPVPAPSSLDAIAALPAFKGAVAMMVELKEAAERAVRINITVPERSLAVIDRAADAQGMNRSAFLTRAAESIANAVTVASDAEFKDWALRHLAKGGGANPQRYWIATFSGTPHTPDLVREKLGEYSAKRRTSVPDYVAKHGRDVPTPLPPRARRT